MKREPRKYVKSAPGARNRLLDGSLYYLLDLISDSEEPDLRLDGVSNRVSIKKFLL